MKTPLLYLILMLSSLAISAASLAPWQKASLHEHLTEVNVEWDTQMNTDPLLASIPFQFATDQQRIQLHLQLVEQRLSTRPTNHLNDQQRTNRLHHLAILRQYWQAGQFPQNDGHAMRQPYFVDAAGTHCAVGYLLAQDGATSIVDAVKNQQNYSYLAELAVNFPALPAWAEENGFTLNELAWIQPGYPPVSRGWDGIGNGGGCNGEVLAMANYQDEWIAMAGQFSEMDGQAANNIIGWDGEAWFNFGEGLNGIVYDLDFLRSHDLIAVGDFTLYNDPTKHNIAVWNRVEERWEGMQSGDMNGPIYTIDHYGYFGPYFIGGEFSAVDGETGYQNLAFFDYDFQNEAYLWSNHDGDFSVDGPVYDLQINSYRLLVAGEFSLTGTMSSQPEQMLTAGNLAYWDENDAWVSSLHTELPAVKAAKINDGYLYVGDATDGKVEVLNAGLWQPLSGIQGVYQEEDNHINGFVEHNEEIYAYGNLVFSPVVGDYGQSLAAINGLYSSGLALFNDEIKAATSFQGELFVAGDFTSVDNEAVNGLASSDLLITSTDDPLVEETLVSLWSHGQQVYLKTIDLPDHAQLSFYNLQGQLLQTRQFDGGSQLTSFALDYQGAVLCQVQAGSYAQTFKLALFD